MNVSYDVFISAFLAKVTEYDFLRMDEDERTDLVNGYMKRACVQFNEVCKFDLTKYDDRREEFTFDGMEEDELDEIVEIVSEGMLVQWMKQHMYNQENLRNALNTADFSMYSPAELTYRITNAYKMCRKDYTAMVREYSYRHGDLTVLHL